MTVVAETVNKLGQWCLELFPPKHQQLLPSPEHLQSFEMIFSRTILTALNLLDCDKPRIGKPVLQFLQQWLSHMKKLEELS